MGILKPERFQKIQHGNSFLETIGAKYTSADEAALCVLRSIHKILSYFKGFYGFYCKKHHNLLCDIFAFYTR